MDAFAFFQCYECDYVSMDRSELHKHVKTFHFDSTTDSTKLEMQSECETALTLTCNKCEFFSIEPSHLENHIRIAHTR